MDKLLKIVSIYRRDFPTDVAGDAGGTGLVIKPSKYIVICATGAFIQPKINRISKLYPNYFV